MKQEKRKADWILWTGAVLAGILLFILLRLNASEGTQVVVYVEGKVWEAYSLYHDTEMVITGKNGGTNRLIIEKGKARIGEASCPDKLCVHQHEISKAGESIICLPNEVVLEIESRDGEGGGLDAIAK